MRPSIEFELMALMFASGTDDAADIFDWSTMTPGYFETSVGPRMVVTDTLILICDRWQNASEQEQKELFYKSGLVHLHRVAALEIPGEMGEQALEAIDSIEGWPAEPILERARKIIADSRTVLLAQLSNDTLPAGDRAAITAYRDILPLRRRFKADDERRWNWLRLVRSRRPAPAREPKGASISFWPRPGLLKTLLGSED